MANIRVVRGSRGQNLSYILSNESGEGLVVDPSFSGKEIWSILMEEGIDLKYIVNTHGHFDHTEGNAWLAEKTGAQVAVHGSDASKLRSPPQVLLGDGDVLRVGDTEVKIIHTPGHTPGGICLLCGKDLFTGDTLFTGNCGRTDLPGGSDEQLFKSLQRLKELDGDVRVHPGHYYWGEESTIEVEKRENPAMVARDLVEFGLVP
jgi:glyoxylase-like metal-dependent hydrolase (beta-lactamase superfamily II)